MPEQPSSEKKNSDAQSESPESEHTEGSESGEQKTRQADHAWDRRGDSEFKKLGIDDAKQLQEHAEEVRSNPDFQKSLDGDRQAYGKFHQEGSTKGTIVVDNPMSHNGGAIMTHEDIERRMRKLT